MIYPTDYPVQEKKTSLRTGIGLIITDWIKNTTFHGLSSVGRSQNKFRTTAWLVIFLINFGCCFILTFTLLKAYFEYKTISTKQFIRETQTDFPIVKICTQKFFTSQEGIDFFKNYYQILFSNASPEYANKSEYSKYIIAETLARNHLLSRQYNDSFRQSLTIPIDKLLLSCKFDKNACNSSDFEFDFMQKTSGACYSFKLDKQNIMKLSSSGRDRGLTFSMIIPETSLVDFFMFKGGMLFLQDHRLSIVLNDFIPFSSGFLTNIGVKKIEYFKQSKSQNTCVKTGNIQITKTLQNDSYYREAMTKSDFYHKKICVDICIYRIIEDACKCYYNEIIADEYNVPCDNLEAYECFVKITEDTFTYQDYCSKNCPESCHEVDYEKNIDTAVLSFQNLIDKVHIITNNTVINKTNITEKSLQNTVCIIRVYFDNIGYEVVNEIFLVSLNNLISGFGGLMGLLLGASILSLLEIFEVILRLIGLFFKRFFK